jgi:IclR family acetate operon transcriptional repressor
MACKAPAARNAIIIVELLCDSDEPLGVSEIAARAQINKNMAFRVLHTLLEMGWVVQDGADLKYRMSLRAFHYVSKPVARMNLKAAAGEPVRDLWRKTGQSTYLGVLDDDAVLYLEHLDATGPVHIAGTVGGRYALHCSAPGKVLLAHAGDELFERLAERGFARQSRQTITSPGKLARELAAVREQGYALDIEEYADGLMCFAAPVCDYTGDVVGVVGISVLTLYFTRERMETECGPAVLEAARRISAAMGCPGLADNGAKGE